MHLATATVAVFLASTTLAGCLFPATPDPISAGAAFERAEALAVEKGFSDRRFVGIVGIEGAFDAQAVAKLLKDEEDAFSRAHFASLADPEFRLQHPDGKLGDGLLGQWSVIYLVPGDQTKSPQDYSLLTVHVASGNGGPGVTLIGPGPGVPGGLNACEGREDGLRGLLSSQEAARTAGQQEVLRTAREGNPNGDFVYEFITNEGFWDGCRAGPATPLWEVIFLDLDAAITNATTSVSVLLDATTGDVVEADSYLTELLPAGPTTLLEAHLSFDNPVPCDLGCGTAGDDPEIGRFTLTGGGADDVHLEFTLVSTAMTVFADNCRLWQGEGETELVEQAAFNGGSCTLDVDHLDAGLYRAVFSTDQLDPTGHHEVDVIATGVLV